MEGGEEGTAAVLLPALVVPLVLVVVLVVVPVVLVVEGCVLTEILAWNSDVGTMGMEPPCFPNFLSKLSWTDTEERRERIEERK